MSFDVFLMRFRGGELAEANRQSVLAVLSSSRFRTVDPGFYTVEFPNGVEVEFSADIVDGSERFTSCAFHIRNLSNHVIKFIFEVAKAGDMVILPAMENSVPILTSPNQKDDLPKDLLTPYPEPVVCQSPAELEILLSEGYAGWRKYRDHVVGEASKPERRK